MGVEWDPLDCQAGQGPGPPVGHTLAFDSTRSRMVLFGGLTVDPSAATAAQNVMGDTWEQTAREQPPSQIVVELAALDITPNPVGPGGEVVITVTLVAAAPGYVNVEFLVEGDVEPFTVVAIQPGQTSASMTLPIAPDTEPDNINIIAAPVRQR